MKGRGKKGVVNRREFLTTTGAGALGAAGMGLGRSGTEGAESGKRFRVIDVHFHTFNSDLQGTQGIPYNERPDATIEKELAYMDRGGVDKAFLISYNAEDIIVDFRALGLSPVTVLPVVNKGYQVKAWQAHKDRFWWVTDHVNPLHDHYLEDLEHDFELGASGVKLLPMFHGLLPDNLAWLPVYELCQKHRKPIIIDWSWWYIPSGVKVAPESVKAGGGPFEEMGFGFNESKERQELCKSYRSYEDWVKPMDPIFEKFADVPISLAHCGALRSRDDYEPLFAFIARHPNVHCDIAAILDYNPWFIEQLVKAVGARKVMYGTDAPYWFSGPDSYRAGSRRWGVISEDCFFLSDEEKQLILAGNAERFINFEM